MAFASIQSLELTDIVNTTIGLLIGNGAVWYVDSGHPSASDNGSTHGTAKTTPFATLKFAVGQYTASNGDVILIAPGHSETITAADGIRFDRAGVEVIGLGTGTDRPTFNFTTATTADIEIDAANVKFFNLYFDMTGVASLAAGIDVNAAHFKMIGCEVLQGDATNQALIAVDLDAGADNAKILHSTFISATAGTSASAINISGALTNIEIGHVWVDGDFDDACIASGSVFTEGLIHHCFLKNDLTGQHSIELTSAATGFLSDNRYINDLTKQTGVDPGSMRSFESYHASTVDDTATVAPTAA